MKSLRLVDGQSGMVAFLRPVNSKYSASRLDGVDYLLAFFESQARITASMVQESVTQRTLSPREWDHKDLAKCQNACLAFLASFNLYCCCDLCSLLSKQSGKTQWVCRRRKCSREVENYCKKKYQHRRISATGQLLLSV